MENLCAFERKGTTRWKLKKPRRRSSIPVPDMQMSPSFLFSVCVSVCERSHFSNSHFDPQGKRFKTRRDEPPSRKKVKYLCVCCLIQYIRGAFDYNSKPLEKKKTGNASATWNDRQDFFFSAIFSFRWNHLLSFFIPSKWLKKKLFYVCYRSGEPFKYFNIPKRKKMWEE